MVDVDSGPGNQQQLVSTPYYFEAGNRNERNTLQYRVLNYYVGRAVTNIYSAGANFETSRAERAINIFSKEKYGILDAEVVRAGTSPEEMQVLRNLQSEILQSLEDDLQVGYRLMHGFSALRREKKRETDLGAAAGNTWTHQIKPEQIFGDVVYSRESNYIGLSSDPTIFTRKRAFLGYVDPEKLIDRTTGLLNDKSILFREANTALSTVAFNGFGSRDAFVESENAEDLTRAESYDSLRLQIKEKIVYSIPIDEVVEDVGCLPELYEQDTGNSFIGAGPDMPRKMYIMGPLFEYYEDKMLKKILSLKKLEDGKRKIMGLSEENMYAEEVKKVHRVVFDLLFPLDRYAANHFLQNVEIMNEDDESQSILFGTKLMIWSLIDQTINYNNMEVSTTDLVASAGGPDAPKLNISNIMSMLMKLIIELGKIAMRTAVRETVRIVDPGYKDMRKGYLKDPCSMRAGLTKRLIGPGKIKNIEGDENWDSIKKGFVDLDGCKVFVPMNKFPGDMTNALASIVVDPVGGALKVKSLVDLMKNTVKMKDERYGMPQTFITNWALSVGEIPSEDHRYLKKNNDCEDQDCETKEVVEPIGLCEDGEESEESEE